MSLVWNFARKTVAGGLLFLVPVTIVAIVIGKLASALEPLTAQLAGLVLGPDVLGPIGRIAALSVCLVALSFLAGLLASTLVGEKVMNLLETGLLNRVPGYAMVKNVAADSAANLARIESSDRVKVVYVKSGDGWQIGFVTGQLSEEIYTVFVPDAPTPSSGQLLFLTADQFVESGLRISDALKSLTQLGVKRGSV